MTTEAFDMTDTIVPKSDQINAEDILTGPVTITITGVKRGNAEQPVDMINAEFPGRAYRPSKTMRRVIVNAWGKDASAYVGRRIRIYRDPDVKFGPDKVGGIKISHLSHIDKRMEIALTVTRGRRAPFVVEPLPDDEPVQSKAPKPPTATAISDAFEALGVTLGQLETRVGSERDQWTADDIATLAALGKAIKAGDSTVWEEFDDEQKPESVEAEQGTLQ